MKILKEIYAEGGVDNDTVMKITGSVAGGNKKKISEAIKRFKNESLPKIVVTVDLLTTGSSASRRFCWKRVSLMSKFLKLAHLRMQVALQLLTAVLVGSFVRS